ncbi:MAG: hypothetical protein H0V29_07535, partial [Thermoleophilaceae bacterium]|nr:hypothetical protein [Thermoleophilaceae bacterium]
ATETAGESVNGANAKSQASEEAAPDAQTSTTAKEGAVPVGGGNAAPPADAAQSGPQAPGLVTVPLTLKFDGRFFKLADFFHDLKRFVRVANNRIAVSGRLITIDSLGFTSEEFPNLKVEVGATAYLSPKAEGAAAGATPQGPATADKTAPASGGSEKAPTTPPTATATP